MILFCFITYKVSIWIYLNHIPLAIYLISLQCSASNLLFKGPTGIDKSPLATIYSKHMTSHYGGLGSAQVHLGQTKSSVITGTLYFSFLNLLMDNEKQKCFLHAHAGLCHSDLLALIGLNFSVFGNCYEYGLKKAPFNKKHLN